MTLAQLRAALAGPRTDDQLTAAIRASWREPRRTAARPSGSWRRWLGVLLAVVLVLGALLWWPAPTPSNAAVARPAVCEPQAEMARTVAELGDDLTHWERKAMPYGGYVEFDGSRAYVSNALPCRYVADVTRHEWMHLQQIRAHGSWGRAWQHYGDRAELVADCGSMLLGSLHTPYVAEALHGVSPGCEPETFEQARALIAFRR